MRIRVVLLISSSLTALALAVVGCGGSAATPTATTSQQTAASPAALQEPTADAPAAVQPAAATSSGAQQTAADIAGFTLPTLNLVGAATDGAMVTWTNRDGVTHTATSGTPTNPTGEFDSGFLTTGQSHSFTFTKPGTFSYFCRVHPTTMRGTITVTLSSAEVQPADEAPPAVQAAEETTLPAPAATEPSPAVETSTADVATAAPIYGAGELAVDIANFTLPALHLVVTPTTGARVTWTNRDGVTHTITSGAPEDETGVFGSGFLSEGQSYSFNFGPEGTYSYFCEVHSYMRGTITVEMDLNNY